MGKKKPKGGKKQAASAESESTGSKELEADSQKSDTSSDYYTARSSASLSSGGSSSTLNPIDIIKKESSPQLVQEVENVLSSQLEEFSLGIGSGDGEQPKKKRGKKKGQQAQELQQVKEEVVSTSSTQEVRAPVVEEQQKKKKGDQNVGRQKTPQPEQARVLPQPPQVVAPQPQKSAWGAKQKEATPPHIQEQPIAAHQQGQHLGGPPQGKQQFSQTQGKKQQQQQQPVPQTQPLPPKTAPAWGKKPVTSEAVPPQQQQQKVPASQQKGAALPQQGQAPSQYQQRGPPQKAQPERSSQLQFGDLPATAPTQQRGPALPQQGQAPAQYQQKGPPQRAQPARSSQLQFGDSPPVVPTPKASPAQTPRASPAQTPAAPAVSKTAAATEGSMVPYSSPKRTPGTIGRKILVETNHFALNVGNLKEAYHYDVTIDPDRPKRMMRPVMEEFRKKYYPKCYPAFDGTKNLYSAKLLPIDKHAIEGEIQLAEDANSREKEYKVHVKFATAVDLTVLQKYFNSTGVGGHKTTPQEAIQCLDIVLRNAPALSMTPVGRSFFSPPSSKILPLEDGMEMWYGFYQSAILGWKPFLNVDIVHKAFPKTQHVLDLMVELCRMPVERLECRSDGMRDVEKFLKGLKVQIELPRNPSSRRTMRVNGFSQKSANQEVFKHENATLTVQQYFETVKKIKLGFPHLPCLWVGSKDKRVYYPSEFCTVMPGQVVQRKMTANQTRNMIKESATSTDIRKSRIYEQFRRSNHKADNCIREFGISVADAFERVDARVLPPPAMAYSKCDVNVSRGVWRANSFLAAKELHTWTIFILDRCFADKIENFVKLLKQVSREVGMSIAEPRRPFVTKERMRYGREKDELKECFQNAVREKMQLVFVIIPDAGFMYSNVKQAAEIAVGCLTQCVLRNTVNRMNPATVGNILLKVNAKLDGTNHHIARNFRPKVFQQPVMIMGADVTHPPPESQNKPSVAAVTASHDPGAFKYNICWRLQPPKEEIILDLENIILEQLKYFYKVTNHMKPRRIIFYRDGVSEGQFDTVKAREIRAIRSACSKLEADTFKPAITFFVVQKRHHTRFFPTNPRDSEDRNNNVPAGTCVDRVITHPTASDFYLVSHASIQGVARPTKYRTLWDDSNMTEDEIEQLTYYLCHMFSRCSRSVSYPAPTYYAHLAAARANVYYDTDQISLNDLTTEQERKSIKEVIRKGFPMFFV